MASIENPGLLRHVLGYLLVGCAWGLTTPFMRQAAIKARPQSPRHVPSEEHWIKTQCLSIWHSVLGLVQQPAYTIPLLINLSGSVMFFIIVGQAGDYPKVWNA